MSSTNSDIMNSIGVSQGAGVSSSDVSLIIETGGMMSACKTESLDLTVFLGDNVESDFEYEGCRCIVKISPLGHRCGYVLVPTDKHSHVDIDNLIVHGGVTFKEQLGNFVAYGFDCAHLGDAPDPEFVKTQRKAFENTKMSGNKEFFDEIFGMIAKGHVWSRQEVEEECRHLADQLADSDTEDILDTVIA